MGSRNGRAYVEAVCVVARLGPGYFHETAIDKRPRSDRVHVGELGLAGDRQVDSSHGGPDAAVYVYAEEDAAHWAQRLDRDRPAGLLGENVRTSGLDVCAARLGERWRMGEVLLEVRKPRTPCRNLAMRVGIEGFHLEFNRSGLVGALCRVVEPGTIGAGDEVAVVSRPDHDVTIAAYVRGFDARAARGLLDSGVPVVSSVRAKARRVIDRAARRAMDP